MLRVVEIGPVVLEKIFKFRQCIFALPLEKGVTLHLRKFHSLKDFLPSSFEIGPVVQNSSREFQVSGADNSLLDFQKGDNYEKVKIHLQNLKIFSRTTGPISTKLGTKHPLVKGIQVYSNE